ncbi:MAG: hypothetical protein PHV68_07890 [Candidatus Gastranaerophilales bacterium]|nr:hypothetical protein [Candidatus Gastranaerophilales bacterium]
MNKFIFQKIILPAYYAYKGKDYLKYYYEFSKRDEFSAEQLKEIQWNKLKKLLKFCYEEIPYYRNLFVKNDLHPLDIRNFEDYAKLPELKKENIRDDYQHLIYPKLPQKELCFSSTGGSTGIPVKIYKSVEDNEKGYSLRYRSNAWCDWYLWDKSVWLVADLKRLSEQDLKCGCKQKIGNWLRRKLILDTRNCKKEDMFNWVKQINSNKPEHLYGYTSLIEKFAHFILENNLEIKCLKNVFTTAEPLRFRKDIEKAFNANVYDQYGSSEIPCIAHECKEGNMHINIDEVLVEFVDIENCNEIKKIVCTPLYIYGMPLLRYDLGDIAVKSEIKCSCNLSYPVMELKIGRISDNLLSPNGKLLPTANIGWHLSSVTNAIKQFQIIQNDISTLEVYLAVKDFYNNLEELKIKNLLQGLLKSESVDIKFIYLKEIKPSHNGKYRPVISNVLNNNSSLLI